MPNPYRTCSKRPPWRQPGGQKTPPWPGAPGNAMSKCRRCGRRARASSRSCVNSGWPRRPCAASTAPPASMSCWRRPATAGRPSSMTGSPTCTSGGTRAAPTYGNCSARSATGDTTAATARSGTTCSPSVPWLLPRRPGPPRQRSVTSPPGCCATQIPSTTMRRHSSSRYRPAARTWTPSPGTSPSSPRCSPNATASAWMPGSPLRTPATCPVFTPLPPGSGGTMTPCLTGLPCPTAPERSRATSTG